MHRLRDSVLSLLIHLAFLFNIERLDLIGRNAINIDTAVYMLTILAIVLILTVRWLSELRRPMLISLGAGVYFVVKLIFLYRRPLLGGVYTYLSFTELGLFIIAVLLAQNLAVNMEDFEQALKNFTFANVRKIKRIQEAGDEIQSELYRSRRHRRPLSVIVVEHDPEDVGGISNKIVQEAQHAMTERYISVLLARELTSKLRRTDMLLENDSKSSLVILSPETNTREVETLIDRLRSITQQKGIYANFGTATFPDHSLTFEHLLKHAEVNLQQRIDNHIEVDSFEEVEIR